MRRLLRGASNDRLSITIPAILCEHLRYQTNTVLYALVKKQDMILTQQEVAKDNPKYNYITSRSLVHVKGSKNLCFVIPKKIVTLLKYYPGQEVEMQLRGLRFFVYKLWGE